MDFRDRQKIRIARNSYLLVTPQLQEVLNSGLEWYGVEPWRPWYDPRRWWRAIRSILKSR